MPAPAFQRRPLPLPIPNPPEGLTPAQTRGWITWSPPEWQVEYPAQPVRLPRPTWSPAERAAYEARLSWFYEARYGLFYHFLAFGDRQQDIVKGFYPREDDWTAERWNRVVEAVDVEQAADQIAETGAGYVVLTLGQWHRYACAPNPLIDTLWGLQPGQYNARRDLPLELGQALVRRGIHLMLYIMADRQHALPPPDGWTEADRYENWIAVARWYSDHYGVLCRGWWVDFLNDDYTYDFRRRFTAALRHGNPDALLASSQYELSDFLHGHCLGAHAPDSGPDWAHQRVYGKPYFGRWDPDFGIQWHALQYLGSYWGAVDAAHPTDELVTYAADIIRGGGVLTFDVGAYRFENGVTVPCLDILPAQFAQLAAVRAALA
jgi:hypothetical protein